MRVCRKCKVKKDIEEFDVVDKARCKYNPRCKQCRRDYMNNRNIGRREKNNEFANIRRQIKTSKGICRECTLPVLNNSKQYCEECYFKHVAYNRLGTRSKWKELREVLEKQGYKCAYTQEILVLGDNAGVDYIQPVSRYPELKSDISNIQWVTKKVNWLKTNFTEKELIFYCSKILPVLTKKFENVKS